LNRFGCVKNYHIQPNRFFSIIFGWIYYRYNQPNHLEKKGTAYSERIGLKKNFYSEDLVDSEVVLKDLII